MRDRGGHGRLRGSGLGMVSVFGFAQSPQRGKERQENQRKAVVESAYSRAAGEVVRPIRVLLRGVGRGL